MNTPSPYVCPGLIPIPGSYSQNPLLLAIANIVSDEFNIPIKAMEKATRKREVVIARQTWMIAMKEFTELSLERIGAIAGGKDHATVLHGLKQIRRCWIKDPHYGPIILNVIDRIENISNSIK